MLSYGKDNKTITSKLKPIIIMIRKLLLAVMLTTVTSAFSQLEAVGGIGIAKFSEKSAGEKIDSHKSTLSGKLGFVYWIPFEDARFSINPGIFYGNAGSKLEGVPNNTTITLGYITAPVDFVYRLKPIESSFFFSAGGYYGYLVSAETKEGELKIDDGDYSYKRSDYGINLGAGYVFSNGLTLRGIYSQGLANILNYPSSDSGSHIKNSNIGISIGYIIFKKRI